MSKSAHPVRWDQHRCLPEGQARIIAGAAALNGRRETTFALIAVVNSDFFKPSPLK